MIVILLVNLVMEELKMIVFFVKILLNNTINIMENVNPNALKNTLKITQIKSVPLVIPPVKFVQEQLIQIA